MFKVLPEKYRIKDHPLLGSHSGYGNAGAFVVPLEDNVHACCIASDGDGWEHVSVHIVEDGKPVTPTWEEMCRIKNSFWDEEDCVVQYHPPKSQHVNNHEHTLHLWRPINEKLPMPPSIMVGIKDKENETGSYY